MRLASRTVALALGLALATSACGRGNLEPPIFEPRGGSQEASRPTGLKGSAAAAPEAPGEPDFKPAELPPPPPSDAPKTPEPEPYPTPVVSAPPASNAVPDPALSARLEQALAEKDSRVGSIQGMGDIDSGGSRGFTGDGAGGGGAAPGRVAGTLAALANPSAADPMGAAGPMGGEGFDAGAMHGRADDAPSDYKAKRDQTAEELPRDGLVVDSEKQDRDGKLEEKEEKNVEGLDRSRFAHRDADYKVDGAQADPDRFAPPATVLPRMFYFENTYLGGSAAYAERLRRLDAALSEGERHYQRVRAEAQPFDPPSTDGLGLTASVDATHIDGAQRVFLQVGLRGSDRYGWRRPPLDVVLVVDAAAFANGASSVTEFVVDLMRKLGSADRLAIVMADREARTFLELTRTSNAQQHLARRIDALAAPTGGDDDSLARAMRTAGAILQGASDDDAVVPGSETVLVLTSGRDAARVAAAASAAHDLTIQGAVTSVFALGDDDSEWWQVANAGYGNLHRVTPASFEAALDEEMADLARVVARLVRVNVRLGKDVDAIRVLGTRVLDAAEVEAVKAREAATDANLSKTMGITQDRGEDDDGIQTVIPYFYGDDSHVILIELWVKSPGLVADVTVRYKDMVNLDNATARTSVKLGARPQAPTREQELIARNVRGFELGESLQHASIAVRHGNASEAIQALDAARAMAAETNGEDVRAVEGLRKTVESQTWQASPAAQSTLVESLLISGQRRVGDTATEAR